MMLLRTVFCAMLLACFTHTLFAQDALIPREVLFGNPERASVQVSPDGSMISFLAPVEGVLNVWVAPAENVEAARPVTTDNDRGIRRYFWAYTNDHVIYLQDKGGDENWRAYSVNVHTGEEVDLTPFTGVQARIQHVSPDYPETIIVGVNNRDPRFHDLYRVNIITGERELILENPGLAGFMADDDYDVRFGFSMTPEGGQQILKMTESGFVPYDEIPMQDALTTGPIGFDDSGQVLYMTDSRGRNTSALTTVNLDTGEVSVVAENPRADISDVMLDPKTHEIEAAAFTYARKNWSIIDKAIRDDFAYLKGVADGDFEVTTRSLDDTRWIVAYLMDDGPVRYYRYDREPTEAGAPHDQDLGPGEATFLFTNRPALEGLNLAQMHPVIIEARDGLDLVSYLTLPAGVKMPPEEPLPMVLLVHGGPWARDSWGYDPMHQWLADRGYAVLSVNYRGSTGFGKDFVNAANMEWAGAMHDDLIDAVNWAIESGVADPERVGIMGGSYGGYATLVGLTFTPDVFAAGVDIVGPSNLITLLESIPAYWKPIKSMFASRVGDDATPEGRALLIERSPLTHVGKIVDPLLIGQGANDPRVKQAEADQIVQAMRARDIPVTYVLFPDEGHGFARPENRIAFYAVAEKFLAEHLGGRAAPIGDDFEGSSITVPAGKEAVSGLAAALESSE